MCKTYVPITVEKFLCFVEMEGVEKGRETAEELIGGLTVHQPVGCRGWRHGVM
jgi:hypothetical protein